MNWNIPGTTLTIRREDAAFIEQQFSSMFLGGGIVLSQVSAITGLEAYTIQNWVKRGFLPAPEHKRYNMNQLCRITTINMLKSALPMEKITGLISYLNGILDDDSDDIIDDAALYFLFVRLAARTAEGNTQQQWQQIIDAELKNYREPVAGGRERVKKVLQIMLMAWSAAKMQKQAEQMLAALEPTLS